MEQELLPVGVEVGSGTAMGFIAGYATKKIIKAVVVIAGLFVGLLKYLETQGVVEGINWEKLVGLAPDAPEAATGSDPGALMGFVDVLPFGGGFAVGFGLGMKRG